MFFLIHFMTNCTTVVSALHIVWCINGNKLWQGNFSNWQMITTKINIKQAYIRSQTTSSTFNVVMHCSLEDLSPVAGLPTGFSDFVVFQPSLYIGITVYRIIISSDGTVLLGFKFYFCAADFSILH